MEKELLEKALEWMQYMLADIEDGQTLHYEDKHVEELEQDIENINNYLKTLNQLNS